MLLHKTKKKKDMQMEYFEHAVARVFQLHCSLKNSMSKQNGGGGGQTTSTVVS
jgi:hypothetical protein